jgi:hypothetical protein
MSERKTPRLAAVQVAPVWLDHDFLRNLEKTGGTCIIDPRAEIIAEPMAGDEEGIIYADADFEACIRGRLVHDVAGHYNRPDVYRLLINNAPSGLVLSGYHEYSGSDSQASPRLLNQSGPVLGGHSPARMITDTSQ